MRQNGLVVDAHALTGATLLGLAMFATLFLGAVIAVFLTFSAIRGDAEQGLLQPVVVRPPGRTAFLAARYAAACLICCRLCGGRLRVGRGYHGPGRRLVARQHRAPGPRPRGARSASSPRSRCLGSVYLSTIANGIAVLMVYGAGLVSGLLGQIGYALPSQRLQEIGRDASWALPFDALYQGGLHALTANTSGLTGVIVHLGPLGGAQGGGPALVAWSAAYVAVVLAATVVGLNRRDL